MSNKAHDIAVFQLGQVEAELDTLWRVMFGSEARPKNPRRALARCWAKAMHVDWGVDQEPRQPPIGLVMDEPEDAQAYNDMRPD